MGKVDKKEYAFADTVKPDAIKEPFEVKVKRVSTVETKYGDKRTLVFDKGNEEKQVFLNAISLQNLVDAFGDETDDWHGKKVRISVVQNELTQGKKAVEVQKAG